jgi:hypothetical protein
MWASSTSGASDAIVRLQEKSFVLGIGEKYDN